MNVGDWPVAWPGLGIWLCGRQPDRVRLLSSGHDVQDVWQRPGGRQRDDRAAGDRGGLGFDDRGSGPVGHLGQTKSETSRRAQAYPSTFQAAHVRSDKRCEPCGGDLGLR